MKHKRQKIEKIFDELCLLEDAFRTQFEARNYCYENGIDCLHTEIGSEKLLFKMRNIINRLDIFIINMSK